MVAAVLFGILFIISVSFVCVFVFYILSPSLKKQNIPFESPLVSETELLSEIKSEKDSENLSEKRAVVLCSPEKKCGENRLNYSGSKNCALFFSVFDTEYSCRYMCAGFGDCVKSCSRGAISIKNKTAVVNKLCNGCGKCIESCPHGLIKLVFAREEKVVRCAAPVLEKVDCSAFLSDREPAAEEKRDFKFWKKCYTIFCKR
ncbi:4Fe-4S binding protein [Treponema sp.]|uniref:4Fe-4S binding protein n=1 Tax=Treponema sp. TaxID=166 RepID=UPI003EFDBE97